MISPGGGCGRYARAAAASVISQEDPLLVSVMIQTLCHRVLPCTVRSTGPDRSDSAVSGPPGRYPR